LIYMHNLTIKI